MSDARQTYIYLLLDPETGAPRYVGKTVLPLPKRIDRHMAAARRGGRTRVARWLARLARRDVRPLCRILEVVAADEDWAAAEKRWIAAYREAFPNLCNLADGGEGAPGIRPSSDAVARRLAKATTAEARQRVAQQSRAMWAQRREQIIAAQNAGKGPAYRAVQARKKAEQWSDPAWRQMQVATRKRVIPDGEVASVIARAAAGEAQSRIAATYGVSQSLVSRIISGARRAGVARPSATPLKMEQSQ